MSQRANGGTATSRLAAMAASLLILVGLVAPAPASAAPATAPAPAPVVTPTAPSAQGLANSRRSCATPQADAMRCHARIRTDVAPVRPSTAGLDVVPSGLSPANLQAAYGLTAAAAANGTGVTVAIVDAYDAPNAEADLGVYRAQFGLTPCTTANGCFRKINQTGGATMPAYNAGWAEEINLDLQMVSAVCPKCNILLVEATDALSTNLGAAVNQAVAQGAKFVSMSYGSAENLYLNASNAAAYESIYYNHPGVVMTVSSGDAGYGVEYPAAFRWVVSVGGTSLSWNGSAWVETAWSGAGSGCSAWITKPTWQSDACATRMVADVSAVADPNTGVAMYSEGYWYLAGGTSAAAPIVAAAYALSGTPYAGTYPAQYTYMRGGLHDVTSGSNGTCSPSWYCTAVAGRDGPTGLGTPNGVAPFTPAAVPGQPTSVAGTPGNTQVPVTWAAPAANGSTITSYTATSSPGGLTCTTATLGCTVTGLTNGTAYTFTVTATNGMGAGAVSAASASITPRTVPGAPTGVTATAANASAPVSWTAPVSNGGSAITGYTVTSTPGSLTCTTATLGCTVSGLTNGTAYTFTVTATNAAGAGSASSASNSVTPATVPGAPTGVTAAAGNASAAINWSAPASTGGAAISGYTATASPGGATCTTATLGCTVTGLTNGTPYTFTVTATNWAGTGASSSASGAATPYTIPGAPSGVSATGGNTQAVVTWSAAATNGAVITGYTITSSPGSKTCTWTTGPLTCTVTGLTNGTSYTFTATATNLAGTGSASSPSAAVVPATVPGAPTGVGATPGNGTAAVSWSAPASNGGAAITGYTVTSSPGGQTCTTATLGCSVGGLSNGTSYTFTVTATNSAGTSSASTASAAVTPYTLPGAPTGVTATPGTGSVAVTWSAAPANGAAVTGYTVTSSPGGQTCTTATLGCTVSGLTNGTSYTFTVTATNLAGTGAASAASSAATPATVPGAPTGVSATPGNASASVSWTAPGSNGGAAITGYTATASPGGATCTTAALGCTVSGLTNGTSYTFSVRATNWAGTGAASGASPAVTPATVPDAPTDVTLDLPADHVVGALDVTWTAPAFTGGAVITGYIATVLPGGQSCTTTAALSCRITGITTGTAVAAYVTASNVTGAGAESNASALVTPPTPPSASLNALATWTTAASVSPVWGGVAATNTVDHYQVQYRRAAWNGNFSLPVSWQASTVATTAALAVTPGGTYCFSARAVDTQGFASAWTVERCTSTPLDDRSLTRSTGWTALTGAGNYRSTFLQTTTLGAKLTAANAKVKRISLVVTTCSGCGTVAVYAGTTLLRTVSLNSATTVRNKVIVITTYTTVKTVTLSIKVTTSGKKVIIDGLALSKV